MDKFKHSVFLKEENCTGCITCLKRCPTEAIRVRNNKAHIIAEFCIDCGECIKRCPHHAKRSHRDHYEDLEGTYKYLVAIPAPSLYSQFNNIKDVNIILTAILMTGFDDVVEVSAAAELVSFASRKFIKENPDKWPLISTACPTIERLIRVRFPNLISHLLPILPPMEVAAEIARTKAMKETGLNAKDIGIVFISPCPSKVTFKNSPLGLEKSNVDEVIAIKDYYPILLSKMKEAEANKIDGLSTSGKIGKSWAASGGEAYGTGSENYLAADGIENVMQVLEALEDEKFGNTLEFVELNSCNAGCVGGVFTIENGYMAKAKNKILARNSEALGKKYALSPDELEEIFTTYDHFKWTKPVTYEPVFRLGANMMDSMQKMSEVEAILNKLPGLDCGSCGAPTCRALAEDIVTNTDGANISDCIHLNLRNSEE
ncbi:MAG: 4Fe-4S dicluster domain-containing protein [Lachnospiraceae bacterium]|nr:4Fe-4S dicluster domain-containing protein [Lachnospiraceae bacterium]